MSDNFLVDPERDPPDVCLRFIKTVKDFLRGLTDMELQQLVEATNIGTDDLVAGEEWKGAAGITKLFKDASTDLFSEEQKRRRGAR